MASALRLILLQLSLGLINGNDFSVTQPVELEAEEGQSITLRCSFTYPQNYRPTQIDISWRRNEFHGEFIYNTSGSYRHPDYRGRIEFWGHPRQLKTGSIRIHHLKQSDSRRYYCRVETSGPTEKFWQSIPGTLLTVRERRPQPTTAQLTSAVTVISPEDDKLGQAAILIIRAVLALGMLASVWLIGIYLMKRKEVTGSPNGRLREESKQQTRVSA